MHMIIVRVLALLACWRVAWLLIYLLTGFYIGYISINNGISINKIQLDRGFKLTASSVRLRLWGNTRKLVISDLQIILPPSSSESTRKRSPRSLDSEPISLYPSSFVLRSLVYNYTVWKKLLALRHFEKLHEEPKLAMAVPTSDSDDDTGDDTKIAQEETPDSFTTGSSNSSFLDQLMKLLRQFYPQIDAKSGWTKLRILSYLLIADIIICGDARRRLSQRNVLGSIVTN
ncbi:hypothetical protein OY671_003518 [Metschnikowia pulcherrima]|nr:hypothetical protein OY671_003518 [Metschnikowia pulcherrima]